MRRRDLFSFLSGATLASLLGCKNQLSSVANNTAKESSKSGQSSQRLLDCIVRPQQTEGPYFIDEGLNRSDIRSDPSNNSVREGVILKLTFHIEQVSSNACLPIEGAVVDIWHCDAQGVYSDVTDRNFQTLGQKFLRGYQVTDASGTVEFVTIYPGWYPGRTVHIHFKIRSGETSPQSYEFTSQLYFDDSFTDQVFTQPPYNIRGLRSIRNEQDGIFGSEGEQLTLPLIQDQDNRSYAGIFNIGLEIV